MSFLKVGVINIYNIKFYSLFSRSEGTTAIEFALVAPILLLLILGVIEFSLIMTVNSVLEGAVLAAAREGSTGYVPPGQTQDQYITSLIKARVAGLLDTSRLIITIPTASDNPGQIVQYTISYPWPIVSNLLGKAVANGGDYTITVTGLVQNEYF